MPDSDGRLDEILLEKRRLPLRASEMLSDSHPSSVSFYDPPQVIKV